MWNYELAYFMYCIFAFRDIYVAFPHIYSCRESKNGAEGDASALGNEDIWFDSSCGVIVHVDRCLSLVCVFFKTLKDRTSKIRKSSTL